MKRARLALLLAVLFAIWAAGEAMSGVGGSMDLAVASYNNRSVSIMRNDGNGSFTVEIAAVGTGSEAQSITAADFNKDGFVDLAVGMTGLGSCDCFSVFMNNGDGTFAPAVTYMTGGLRGVFVSAADFNGDGSTDIAAANFNGNNVSIFMNNGDGTFGARVDYAAGGNACFPFPADFNGDGAVDLAVSSGWITGSSVFVFINNGDGTFAPRAAYTVGSHPASIFSADFNGDGRPDLAVTNTGSNSVSVLMNNGDGTFSTKVDYAISGTPGSISSVDFNGDGIPDLAVGAGTNGNFVSVLMNNGDGTFAAGVNYDVVNSPRVFSSDFNRDGKPDLAVANGTSASNAVSIFMNNGDGTFASRVDYTTAIDPVAIVAADLGGCVAAKGDMNADGILTGSDVVLMLNCAFLGIGTCTNCFADVNCDGLLTGSDVVLELNKAFLGIAFPC